MSEAQPTTNGAGQGAAPSLRILTQYIKDLSFENPNAPKILMNMPKKPDIEISVNVSTSKIQDNDYEVALHIEAKCKSEGEPVYLADLTYAGVFRIENMPAEAMEPLMLIECPRLIFPFARQIIGDAVRDGGFPPLYLDPIDFAGLYRQRMEQMAAAAQGQKADA